MDPKLKIAIGIVIIVLIVLGGFWIWQDSKYRMNAKYCEANEDCQCYNCGCFNQFRGDYECFFEEGGLACASQGCICESNSCTLLEFPIDSEEKAITYAKADSDVQKFIEDTESYFGVKTGVNAYFVNEQNVWEVGFGPDSQDINDVCYFIRFSRNGTIISKNPCMI